MTTDDNLDDILNCDFDPALNLARASLYRFTALTLIDPRAGSWDELHGPHTRQLVSEAAALVRCEVAARPKTLAPRELSLEMLDPAAIFERLPASPEALNAAYEQTFGLLVSGACPPYEMEFIDSKLTFQRSQDLGDVSGFYRAFGLQPSTVNPERHDHIALQLEFMASLLGLQRAAHEDATPAGAERAAVCRSAQQRFLREHLAWWLPAFGRVLALEAPGSFYEPIGTWLAALVAAERGLLGVEPPAGEAQPSSLERPEECEGCILAT